LTQACLQPYPITYIPAPTLQIKILNSDANALTISKPPLLALLTNVDNASVSTWGLHNSGYSDNENLMEVLNCIKMQADGQGGVNANTGTGQPMVRIPFACLVACSVRGR
jgi:alpha-amylase